MLSRNMIWLQELNYYHWFLQSVHDGEVDPQLGFFLIRPVFLT